MYKVELQVSDVAELYDTVHALRTVSEATPMVTCHPPVLGSVAMTKAVASAHGLLERLYAQIKRPPKAADTEDTK